MFRVKKWLIISMSILTIICVLFIHFGVDKNSNWQSYYKKPIVDMTLMAKQKHGLPPNKVLLICRTLNLVFTEVKKWTSDIIIYEKFQDLMDALQCGQNITFSSSLQNDNSKSFYNSPASVALNDSHINTKHWTVGPSLMLHQTHGFNDTNYSLKFPLSNLNDNFTDQNLNEVCPEIYKGSLFGLPAFIDGFVYTNCTNFKELSSIVSIIINLTKHKRNYLQKFQRIMNNIINEYPDVQILVAVLKHSFQSNSTNIKIMEYPYTVNVSHVWNDLIEHIDTKYVFVVNDIEDFTKHARFKRQIAILSAFSDVGIVGGAVRNSKGYWKSNCYQSKMLNYVLKFDEGYYHSKNECMYCDHIEGPFMAKTTILKEMKIDISLQINIFADLFLRMKQNNITIMSCPDIMHFVIKIHDIRRGNWFPIAKKWRLNRIVLYDIFIHSFTCDDIQMHCDAFSITTSKLMPPCCLSQITNALIKFTKLCEKFNVTCLLDSGSVLGAVKFNGPMPWDLDADMLYERNHYHLLKEVSPQLGYKIIWKDPESVCCENGRTIEQASGFILFSEGDLYIEIYPSDLTGGFKMLGKKQTMIQLGSYHVYLPMNPGLYARNRYGVNCLKHSVSWLNLMKSTSWENYNEAGKFPKCETPLRHSCMDGFTADGNIPFRIPEPFSPT